MLNKIGRTSDSPAAESAFRTYQLLFAKYIYESGTQNYLQQPFRQDYQSTLGEEEVERAEIPVIESFEADCQHYRAVYTQELYDTGRVTKEKLIAEQQNLRLGEAVVKSLVKGVRQEFHHSCDRYRDLYSHDLREDGILDKAALDAERTRWGLGLSIVQAISSTEQSTFASDRQEYWHMASQVMHTFGNLASDKLQSLQQKFSFGSALIQQIHQEVGAIFHDHQKTYQQQFSDMLRHNGSIQEMERQKLNDLCHALGNLNPDLLEDFEKAALDMHSQNVAAYREEARSVIQQFTGGNIDEATVEERESLQALSHWYELSPAIAAQIERAVRAELKAEGFTNVQVGDQDLTETSMSILEFPTGSSNSDTESADIAVDSEVSFYGTEATLIDSPVEDSVATPLDSVGINAPAPSGISEAGMNDSMSVGNFISLGDEEAPDHKAEVLNELTPALDELEAAETWQASMQQPLAPRSMEVPTEDSSEEPASHVSPAQDSDATATLRQIDETEITETNNGKAAPDLEAESKYSVETMLQSASLAVPTASNNLTEDSDGENDRDSNATDSRNNPSSSLPVEEVLDSKSPKANESGSTAPLVNRLSSEPMPEMTANVVWAEPEKAKEEEAPDIGTPEFSEKVVTSPAETTSDTPIDDNPLNNGFDRNSELNSKDSFSHNTAPEAQLSSDERRDGAAIQEEPSTNNELGQKTSPAVVNLGVDNEEQAKLDLSPLPADDTMALSENAGSNQKSGSKRWLTLGALVLLAVGGAIALYRNQSSRLSPVVNVPPNAAEVATTPNASDPNTPDEVTNGTSDEGQGPATASGTGSGDTSASITPETMEVLTEVQQLIQDRQVVGALELLASVPQNDTTAVEVDGILQQVLQQAEAYYQEGLYDETTVVINTMENLFSNHKTYRQARLAYKEWQNRWHANLATLKVAENALANKQYDSAIAEAQKVTHPGLQIEVASIIDAAIQAKQEKAAAEERARLAPQSSRPPAPSGSPAPRASAPQPAPRRVTPRPANRATPRPAAPKPAASSPAPSYYKPDPL